MTDLEENILAAALLWWLAKNHGPVPGRFQGDFLEDAMLHRWDELGCPEDLAVLVADCERRYAVEKCEREVLEAAAFATDGRFSMTSRMDYLRWSVRRLRAARETL